jgi:excisionase family DNA binding protein
MRDGFNKEHYSVKEVAGILGISEENIRRAVWEGKLKAETAGSHVIFIKREQILVWMRDRDAEV